jgi:hypothetical protein
VSENLEIREGADELLVVKAVELERAIIVARRKSLYNMVSGPE